MVREIMRMQDEQLEGMVNALVINLAKAGTQAQFV